MKWYKSALQATACSEDDRMCCAFQSSDSHTKRVWEQHIPAGKLKALFPRSQSVSLYRSMLLKWKERFNYLQPQHLLRELLVGAEAECGGDGPSCAHLGKPRPPAWALLLGADSLTQAELTPKRRCEPVFEKATSWDGVPRGRRQLRLPSWPLQACLCHHGRACSTQFAYTGIHVLSGMNATGSVSTA